MLNCGPKVHGKGPDLDFHSQLFGTLQGFHAVSGNDVITAVATVFHMIYVVLFADDFQVTACPDDGNDLSDVFYKLADNADACDVVQFFLDFIQLDFLSLCFV